jgi:hypothetical protein
MTNVIATQAFDASILDIAEAALVDGVASTGELIQGYADALSAVFNVKDANGGIVEFWFNLRGKDAKGIKARRASFVQRMIARGYTKGVDKEGNPKASATVDTYWMRVKEASGYVPKGRITGGTDVDSKTAAELKTMINRILNAEEEGQDVHSSMILESLKSAYFVLVGEDFDAGK